MRCCNETDRGIEVRVKQGVNLALILGSAARVDHFV